MSRPAPIALGAQGALKLGYDVTERLRRVAGKRERIEADQPR